MKIPACREDRKKEDFDSFVEKYVKQKTNEIFVKWPQQVEAMVCSFEDSKTTYRIKTDPATGQMTVKQYKQDKNNNEYRSWCASIKRKLDDFGLDIEGETFCLATVKVMAGTEQEKDGYKKKYVG